MKARAWGFFAFLAVAALLAAPTRVAAQLPFDLSTEEVLSVDTTALRWLSVRTYLGGAEASLAYGDGAVDPGVCRAVTAVGVVRLRSHYRRLRESEPVSLHLAVRCGRSHSASLRYDGVMVRLEVRDAGTGRLVYQGRRRGLP